MLPLSSKSTSHSLFILVINQLDAQNLFYNKFISSLYMFRAHVLIVRKSKLYYTASGIITHCRWPSRARDGHLQVWWFMHPSLLGLSL